MPDERGLATMGGDGGRDGMGWDGELPLVMGAPLNDIWGGVLSHEAVPFLRNNRVRWQWRWRWEDANVSLVVDQRDYCSTSTD